MCSISKKFRSGFQYENNVDNRDDRFFRVHRFVSFRFHENNTDTISAQRQIFMSALGPEGTIRPAIQYMEIFVTKYCMDMTVFEILAYAEGLFLCGTPIRQKLGEKGGNLYWFYHEFISHSFQNLIKNMTMVTEHAWLSILLNLESVNEKLSNFERRFQFTQITEEEQYLKQPEKERQVSHGHNDSITEVAVISIDLSR
jgi:hypothetical protein